MTDTPNRFVSDFSQIRVEKEETSTIETEEKEKQELQVGKEK